VKDILIYSIDTGMMNSNHADKICKSSRQQVTLN